MFTLKEILREHQRSTWKVSTKNNRKRSSCVPLTILPEPEYKIKPMPRRHAIEEERIGDTIRRRF